MAQGLVQECFFLFPPEEFFCPYENNFMGDKPKHHLIGLNKTAPR